MMQKFVEHRTNKRHVNRLNHALNFAHNYLSKNLNLDLLAQSAHLSKFHFTKLFHDYTGESPISFLNRIRLENAANMLCYRPELLIGDIAANSGYSSNQTFTRAFTNKFGESPRLFRRLYSEKLENALDLAHSNRYANLSNAIVYQPDRIENRIRLVHRKPTTVAYIRNIGSYGISEGIDYSIELIKYWAAKNNMLRRDSKLIGASWDSNEITPNTFCKYDACIEVPEDFPTSMGASIQIIPGGTYAVYRAPYRSNGEISLLWRTFAKCIRSSPELCSYRRSAKPGFEIFGKNAESGESEVELYVRLLKPRFIEGWR